LHALLALQALVHLHAHRVFHLDLKPENILIDSAGRPHIADYDISCAPPSRNPRAPAARSRDRTPDTRSRAHGRYDGATRALMAQHTKAMTRMGTAGFIAPEIEAGGKASAAADIFSLGRTIEQVLPDEPQRRPAELRALVEAMTRQQPEERPTAEAAKQHACFEKLLSGRFEGTRDCMVCLESHVVSDGICCSSFETHFTCSTCLDTHVLRASLILPPDGDEDGGAERSRLRKQRDQRHGRVCCPFATDTRTCCPPSLMRSSGTDSPVHLAQVRAEPLRCGALLRRRARTHAPRTDVHSLSAGAAGAARGGA
jgi:serine/threonine protein kinase